MADNLTPKQRSYSMSQVRNKSTGLEIKVREALTSRGLTFRTNATDLPGKPDIVFEDARTTLFVDGDFWHGYRFPQWEHKLTEFWRVKIAKNRERDRKTHARLRRAGWRVVRIWQHQIEKDLEGRLRNLDSLLARGPIEAA